MMNSTPKSMRLHIGIFGRTNVGKSSVVNKITGQSTSIISTQAGTTTDPVEKSMELPPIGPVTVIDTAGIDDTTELGKERVSKTLQIIPRCDVAVMVCDHRGWSVYECDLAERIKAHKIPLIAVVNKLDEKTISQKNFIKIQEYAHEPILTSVVRDENFIDALKEQIIKHVPDGFAQDDTIAGDLFGAGDIVVLVTPIDKEAPKGRMILPQVQLIRDIIDHDGKAIVVKENQLQSVLGNLVFAPKLVVTDSQAFEEVSKIVPPHIPLTSFSILLARYKGDLNSYVKGAQAINFLPYDAKILIAESCSHHAIEDDIARVKIPKWLKEKTGKNLTFEYVNGHDFPQDLSKYNLIIQCGGCMTNKREVMSRIYRANKQKVPITNYGVVIAFCKGILDRTTQIFN